MAGINPRQFINISHQEHKWGTRTYILTVTRSVQWSSLHLQPGLWVGFSYYDGNEICQEFLLWDTLSCDCCIFSVSYTRLPCLPRKKSACETARNYVLVLQLPVIKPEIFFFVQKQFFFKRHTEKLFVQVPMYQGEFDNLLSFSIRHLTAVVLKLQLN